MVQIMCSKVLCKLFLSIIFLKISVAVDTLSPNQTIGIDQTLVCQSQLYEMGFFSPGNSRYSFLGIWYKNMPKIVVWVANRNDPITDSHGVTFALSGNGSLTISRGRRIIWSANSSSRVASDPRVQLLDTGNLVVVDKTTEGSTESYIWQSFDNPGDTLLQGMKTMDDVNAGVVTYLTSWRSPDDPSPNWEVERGLHGRCSTLSESSFQTMNARKDDWNLVYTFPGDVCDNYGYCGPNGIFKIGLVDA